MNGAENNVLEITDLWVTTAGKGILKGVNLKVPKGEIHALMGPNGSGKSTLASALMGHPKYTVTRGDIRYKGRSLLELNAAERARLGLFLGFQYPFEIKGIMLSNLMWMAYQAQKGVPMDGGKKKTPLNPLQFRNLLSEKLKVMEMDESFADRFVNEGFSGGEKKRAEILQMLVLQPDMAILDETDSGLDIDALKIVSKGVNTLAGPNLGVLIITHYQRILRFIEPHRVHVMVNGRIALSGGQELSTELEAKGYNWILEDLKEEAHAGA